jgi:hypothetical protein
MASPMQTFEMRQEYDELISATRTPEAQAAMRDEGFTTGKQLLLAALFAYLNRKTFLSPEEEEKVLERGRAAQQHRKRINAALERRRIVYMTHRIGKNYRFVESGLAVERADGTLQIFLDRLPVGGWNGYILVPSDNGKPTARDIPTSTPFDDEGMLAAEADAVTSH